MNENDTGESDNGNDSNISENPTTNQCIEIDSREVNQIDINICDNGITTNVEPDLESSQNNNVKPAELNCSKHCDNNTLKNEQLLDIQSPTKDCRISKSRSSFLDESQAIEYLDRQLYGSNMDLSKQYGATEGDDDDMTVPSSPFVQKVENILQYVPAPPAAVQEYVSLFTKNMVSNLKTSWDKFGFVSPQEAMVYDMMSQSSSQDSLSVFSKDSSPCSSKADLSTASQGSMTKSQSLGSIRLISKIKDLERKTSLPNTICTHSFGMYFGIPFKQCSKLV